MTIYSHNWIAFKIPFSFIINKAIAPIGAVFTLLCLISGSIWGKPMWGTWWVWDARLTSVAILIFCLSNDYFFKKTFEIIDDVGEKITAIFIIIGSINLPIIKFSVDWWNTLHQPASISKLSSPSIDVSMLKPLNNNDNFFYIYRTFNSNFANKSRDLSQERKLKIFKYIKFFRLFTIIK